MMPHVRHVGHGKPLSSLQIQEHTRVDMPPASNDELSEQRTPHIRERHRQQQTRQHVRHRKRLDTTDAKPRSQHDQATDSLIIVRDATTNGPLFQDRAKISKAFKIQIASPINNVM
jgi:hypothetical protein